MPVASALPAAQLVETKLPKPVATLEPLRDIGQYNLGVRAIATVNLTEIRRICDRRTITDFEQPAASTTE